ncbi:T9SS type A sorting domain-containing protein, partial [Salibacteraceae bacterium]|nr:T9SS type A sorting domain-containing protein [Salibacteraceae bacterium]
TISVADQNGCMDTSEYMVNQPDSIQLQDSIQSVICSNDNVGSIILNPIGGTAPYSYLWNTSDTTSGLQNLVSGIYSLTFDDANECLIETSFEVQYQLLAPSAFLGNDTTICEGDSIAVAPQSPGSSLLWSTTETSPSISVSAQGQYSVFTSDTNGCSDTDTTYVSTSLLPVFTLGDDIYICHDTLELGYPLIGPAGMQEYLWSTSETTATETALDSGLYWLSVKDSIGCMWTDSLSIIHDTCLGINAISIQGDVSIFPNPNRGIFTIQTSSTDPVEIEIYNAQGGLVRRSTVNKEAMFDLHSEGASIYFIRGMSADHVPWQQRVVITK